MWGGGGSEFRVSGFVWISGCSEIYLDVGLLRRARWLVSWMAGGFDGWSFRLLVVQMAVHLYGWSFRWLVV